MNLTGFDFETTDWLSVEPTRHPGERGVALWRTRMFGAVRVRRVEYSADYLADHWCQKGHVVLCLAGELITELQNGRTIRLTPGMSYQVADNAEPHRSRCVVPTVLFIVD